MTSQVDICNRALFAIASRSSISSINPSDGSTEANACALLFQPTYEMLARAAYWNVFRKQATLSLIQAASGTPENPSGTSLPAPATPWLYAYAYPPDSLMVRYLLPPYTVTGSGVSPFAGIGWAQATSMTPNTPFAVAYATDSSGDPLRVILTNLSQAQAVYTVNLPLPDYWDATFQEAMVAALGAKLVPGLTGNLAMMSGQIKIATALVMDARKSDGIEGLTVVDHIPDWITVRGYGGYFGNGQWGSNVYSPYGSLDWGG